MNTSIRSSIWLASVLLSLAGTAAAEDRRYQAALCNPIDSINAALVAYDQFGAKNNSGSQSARLSCGAATNFAEQVRSVEVIVYDRNVSTDVECTLRIEAPNGNLITSSTRTSQDATSGPQSLFFPIAAPAAGVIQIECTLPPFGPVVGNTSGQSYLTSYRVVSR